MLLILFIYLEVYGPTVLRIFFFCFWEVLYELLCVHYFNFTGRLNAKADVYSFGVLLLELLTGRRALDKIRVAAEQNLVDWTRPCLGDKRKLHRIIDPRLEGRYPKNGAHEFASLALQCIRNDAKLRPNMSEVLASLEKLQDPKYAALPPQSNQKKRSSSTMPRSPMRNPRPPLRPTPSGSSLPSYRA